MFKPLRFAVLLAGVTLAFSALAQPAPDEDGQPSDQAGDQSAPAADPPTRVARLSYLNGDVSFVPAGENDWVEAQLNRPLITGDKLWTDRGSRAELGIGPATLRIDQNTSFDFLNLDDKVAQIELTQGSLNLHVRRLYDEQSYEVDTPTLAFVINRVGDFRIDVQPNGQATVVTVLQGGGEAYGEGGARFRIEEGQSVTFNDPQLQSYESADVPRPDDFDTFNQQRDHRWDNSGSRRYVSEEVIGYEDLDDNGEWNDEAEYGSVWYPRTVAAGWSPYHYGHWGWVGAYGWTWIDDASWGFAPFHYGRWAYINNRWGWCPGPVAVRAVYAPALVAFVGGGGVAVGFGTGPVGWFPLGVRDVYYPSYRVSERYFVSINIGNSRGLDRVAVGGFYGGYRSGHVDYEHIHYGNREIAGAVVAVPHAAFVGAHPVGREAIAVNHETFGNARVSGFAAVAPTRASLVATNRVARASPPAGIVNRPIVAASRPPAPVASFASRESSLQKNPGQPLTVNQLHRPATGVGATAGPAATAGRPNLRVVTNTGAPVHTGTPAPTIAPHSTVGAVGANGRVAPTTNGAAAVNRGGAVNGATGVNGATTVNRGPAGQTGRGVPAVQGNAATAAGGAPNGGAANGGRPVAGSKLDSSRFAHPQGGTPATGNTTNAGNTANTGNAHVVNQTPVQRGASTTPAASPKYTPTEHVQSNNGVNAHTPAATTTTTRPTSTQTLDRGAVNGNASRGSGYGAQGATTGGTQGRPEYHAPVNATPVHQPQVQQQQQQYHAPVTSTPVQKPVQQVQPQQQYHAPVTTNTGQMQGAQQQYHQPPPQPQHVQPAPTGKSQPSGKEKKDDDKRH